MLATRVVGVVPSRAESALGTHRPAFTHAYMINPDLGLGAQSRRYPWAYSLDCDLDALFIRNRAIWAEV